MQMFQEGCIPNGQVFISKLLTGKKKYNLNKVKGEILLKMYFEYLKL